MIRDGQNDFTKQEEVLSTRLECKAVFRLTCGLKGDIFESPGSLQGRQACDRTGGLWIFHKTGHRNRPMCPNPIVYQPRCVPFQWRRPYVLQSHCVPAPLCSIPTETFLCVPIPLCNSLVVFHFPWRRPFVSQSHCVTAPLCSISHGDVPL